MSINTSQLEARLRRAADERRGNSELKAPAYDIPVLGMIYLRYCAKANLEEARKWWRMACHHALMMMSQLLCCMRLRTIVGTAARLPVVWLGLPPRQG